MTPLWARMLVFKAWENKEITEECAHYYDELILEYSKGVNSYAGQYELFSMEEVLNNIAKLGLSSNKFNISHYIDKIHFENGRTKQLRHTTDVYLFEILNMETTNIDKMIDERLDEMLGLYIDLEDVTKLESYFDRLCAKRIIDNPDTIDSIDFKFANRRALSEILVQKDVNTKIDT